MNPGFSGVPTSPCSWPVSKSVATQRLFQAARSRGWAVGCVNTSGEGSFHVSLLLIGPSRKGSVSFGTVTQTSPWLETRGWRPLPSWGPVDAVEGRRWRPALRGDVVVLGFLFPALGIFGILLGLGQESRKVDRDKLDEADVSPDSLLRQDFPWLEPDLCRFLAPSGRVRLASDLRRFLGLGAAECSMACRIFFSKILQ